MEFAVEAQKLLAVSLEGAVGKRQGDNVMLEIRNLHVSSATNPSSPASISM